MDPPTARLMPDRFGAGPRPVYTRESEALEGCLLGAPRMHRGAAPGPYLAKFFA